MIISTAVFVLMILGLVIITAADCVIFWYSLNANKKIDVLLEKGNIKDFKDVFLAQKAKSNDLEKMIGEAFMKIKELQDISRITIQKVGVVRFDPFNEMGGKQSFVVVLLDANNNGFVLSSIFMKENNRVFAKTVKNGKSNYALSDEELSAIEKAIGQK